MKREVQQEVYEEFKEIFESPFYRQKTKVGEVKWKNEVAWAKEKAKKEGLIKWPKNSGRGYWELTDKGVKWKG